MKNKILVVAIIISLLFVSSFSYGEVPFNEDEAKTLLLGDWETGEILYQKNIDKQVEIASITKLMTYIITMDKINEGKISLDDMVLVSHNAATIGGSTFWLREGEKVKLETLLEALLIVSGNDAAVAIAEHVSGTEEEFVKLMNEKAKDIGLNNTKYINASGMPVDDLQNVMTTRDIFNLSRYVISKYPQILKITCKPRLEIESRNFSKENTNVLIGKMENVDGLKTGFTDEAGYCLVSTMEVPAEIEGYLPYRLIAIEMGAKDKKTRKEVSTGLLNYGLNNFSKKEIFSAKDAIKNIEINNADDIEVKVYPSEDYSKIIKKGDKISIDIEINDKLKAPIKKGEEVGVASVFLNNKKIKEMPLVVNSDVKKASFFEIMKRSIKDLAANLKKVVFDKLVFVM